MTQLSLQQELKRYEKCRFSSSCVDLKLKPAPNHNRGPLSEIVRLQQPAPLFISHALVYAPPMPKAQKSKTKRTAKRNPPKAKKGKSRGIILRGSLLFAMLCTIGFTIGFVLVDRQVGEMLSSRQPQSIPTVFAEGQRLEDGIPLSESQLTNLLKLRGYSEQAGTDSTPKQGEFVRRGGKFLLHIRPFRLPNGESSKAATVQLASERGMLKVSSELGRNVSLEPLTLAYLANGTQEIRSSEQLKLEQIPRLMQQAVIAIEDERFYSHHGVDVFGLFRASARNLIAMKIVQGGSTLSQQLIKNMLLTPERSLKRKILEALGALSLEWRLQKDKILEMYLNEVYLGQDGIIAIHGVSQASRAFFARPIEELGAAEFAMLAGIVKGPSFFSPIRHPERAQERRNTVLQKMRELQFISEAEYLRARTSPLNIKREAISQHGAYYLQALTRDLDEELHTEDEDLRVGSVLSGIDPAMQECAESAISQGLEKLEEQYPRLRSKNGAPPLQAALVSIEPYSGRVRSWVGGRNFGLSQFDRVVQIQRQIGSTIKPFLYLTALDPGLNTYKTATPLSILADEPTKISIKNQPDWEPENFDHKYRGDTTLRYALEHSLNIPAIYLSERIGLPNFVSTLKKFRVANSIDAVPSLAVGTLETNLLQLTAAYAALANGGEYIRPRLYLRAFDQEGDTLAAPPIETARVAAEAPVFVLTDMLRGVVERGTARTVRSLGYVGEVAGKTGTSSNSRDVWFEGFTPDLATGIWVGFDDNRELGLTGGAGAVPLWVRYMQCVAQFRSPFSFVAPRDVVNVELDVQSGGISTPSCPANDRLREVFVRGTEPQKYCELHSDGSAAVPDRSQSDQEPHRQGGMWDALFR